MTERMIDMAKWMITVSVAGLIASSVAARADMSAAPEVDIKLAAKYCESARGANVAVDAAALAACMREFGYDRFRFAAGARF